MTGSNRRVQIIRYVAHAAGNDARPRAAVAAEIVAAIRRVSTAAAAFWPAGLQ